MGSFTGLKILFCGGRDYSNYRSVRNIIAPYEPKLIIHGAARGADSLAGRAAKELGIPVRAFPADWNYYGKSAGYIRNRQMLDEGKPDIVVAVPGGKGTAMMMKLARSRGIPVHEYKVSKPWVSKA